MAEADFSNATKQELRILTNRGGNRVFVTASELLYFAKETASEPWCRFVGGNCGGLVPERRQTTIDIKTADPSHTGYERVSAAHEIVLKNRQPHSLYNATVPSKYRDGQCIEPKSVIQT